MSDQYERAMAAIRRGLVKSNGGQTAENQASAAYQQMVAAGEATPLRAKYSRGKRLKQVRK